MGTKVLNLGSKVRLKKKLSNDQQEYTTQIQDIKDNTLLVLTPMYKSALMRLQEGTEVEMLVLDDGRVHAVDGDAGETIVEGCLYYTEIRVRKVKKIERRSYFRVKLMKDVLVREKCEEGEETEFVEATTIDLSGGGIQFTSKKSFDKEGIIQIKLGIDDRELFLEAEVLSQTEQIGLKSYKHTAKFINLDKDTREAIVRYVFKVQREKLRR